MVPHRLPSVPVIAAPLSELVAPDWAAALAPVEPQVHAVGEFLRAEVAAGRGDQPPRPAGLAAFTRPRPPRGGPRAGPPLRRRPPPRLARMTESFRTGCLS